MERRNLIELNYYAIKNIVTLLGKWLVAAAFGRRNARNSVGNHMPAKGIQQTRDNPKKLLVTTISAIYHPPVSILHFPSLFFLNAFS